MKLTIRFSAVSRRALVFSLFLLPFIIHAQDWRAPLNNNENPNFFDIQASFNQYWAGKKPEKGSGWKAFKRWEWFWQQRINPDGSFPAAGANALALQSWLKEHPEGVVAERGGDTRWTSLGPDDSPGGYHGTGRVACLAVHPQNPSILWAGTPAGGLWKSDNGGVSWRPLTDEHPSLGVSAIAIHPFDPNILYIATGDGDANDTYSVGVWRSDNGGETFYPTGLQWGVNQFKNIRALVINPVDPLRLLCAASDGIYFTVNGGQTWTKSMNSGQVSDLEMRPENPDVLYACTQGMVHRTINGGQTWQSVLTVPGAGRIALCVSRANPLWVGVLCSNAGTNRFHSFWASVNGGQAYSQLSNSPNTLGWSNKGTDNGGQGWYDLCVAASPLNANEIFTGGVNIWKSMDGGRSWKAATHWYRIDSVPEVHADHHNLLYGPDGNTLYNCNDGGIYKSTDHGASFDILTGNLTNSQVYHLSVAQQNSAVIAGLQDNGTKLRDISGGWSDVVGGDGMKCLIDPENSDIMYGSLQYGAIYRSKNGGKDWNKISSSMPDTAGAWITPFMINPQNSNQIWAGYRDVWKSDDQGDSWVKVSQNLGGVNLEHLTMAATDSTRLYAASGLSIWRSDNSGKNWVSISSGLPFGTISHIAVHPQNAAEVYITVSGYQPGTKVLRSKNSGQTWENISGNLPNIPASCLVLHQNGKNGMYVGMDIGVFYRDSTTEDWVFYNNGLPNTPVFDLDIRRATNELVAATYGRGVWRVPVLNAESIECPELSNLAVVARSYTSATFRWDSTAVLGYQYRVRPVGTTTWITSPIVKQTTAVQGSLAPDTQYEVQVRSQCQGKEGRWGNSVVFSTSKPEGAHCVSYGSTSTQWIDSVSFANIQNASGNDFGYSYFTDTIQVTAGESYPFAAVAKSVANPQPMFWRAWMDLNGDQDFEDAGELLFQRATSTPPGFSRVVLIPANTPEGLTRFRISMGSTASSSPCVVTPQQIRDVEDYLVYVKANTTNTKKADQPLSFDVHPNPAKDYLYLQLPTDTRAMSWAVTGSDGKVVVPLQAIPQGKTRIDIKIGQLPAGLYWIQVQDSNGKTGQKRFVKQ